MDYSVKLRSTLERMIEEDPNERQGIQQLFKVSFFNYFDFAVLKLINIIINA